MTGGSSLVEERLELTDDFRVEVSEPIVGVGRDWGSVRKLDRPLRGGDLVFVPSSLLDRPADASNFFADGAGCPPFVLCSSPELDDELSSVFSFFTGGLCTPFGDLSADLSAFAPLLLLSFCLSLPCLSLCFGVIAGCGRAGGDIVTS